MNSTNENQRKRGHFKRVFLYSLSGLLIVIAITGYYLYSNFNSLLSEALLKSFNSNIVSDVYELKFSNLNVNPFSGDIRIHKVELLPREKPLNNYPYINSRLKLVTDELLLLNADIVMLLKQNRLQLERIKINEPVLDVVIANKIPVFFPFASSKAEKDATDQYEKRHIEAFSLQEFDLTDASFHVENQAKGRDLNLKNMNISLRDLLYDQKTGTDLMKFSTFTFNIGEITGHLKVDSIRYISLKDYGIIIDSLEVVKSVDSLVYKYSDFNLGFRDLQILTGDSAFNLAVQTFSVAYADSSVNLEKVAFIPNIGENELRKRFKFQHNTGLSVEIGKLSVRGIDFDSLLLYKKLFIRNIEIDSASVRLFKDKTRPVDKTHLPEYLGQSVRKIPIPIKIGNISAKNISLLSREIKPDSTSAEVLIDRGEAGVFNFTNQSDEKPLEMNARAYLAGKVPLEANLAFSYKNTEFNYSGKFEKFNLNDLNEVIESYAPVTISDGIVDGIRFNGKATKTNAKGEMEFLYHNLKMDVQLKNKAGWKNSVLSFAANTVVSSSNPVSEKVPPKVVQYQIERDMNKAFVNVLIKSALMGLKETVIMSKENKELYREAKKKAKEDNKR